MTSRKTTKTIPVTIKGKSGGVTASEVVVATAPAIRAPSAGDIIELNFTPAAGREMIEVHPALVGSQREFNQKSGIAWVCPISQGVGIGSMLGGGLTVTLMGTGSRTQGKIYVYQLRAVDLRERGSKFIETVPRAILEEVRDGIAAIAGITEEDDAA